MRNLKTYIVSYDLMNNRNLIENYTANFVSGSSANVKRFLEDKYGQRVSAIKFLSNLDVHHITTDIQHWFACRLFDQIQKEREAGDTRGKDFNSEYKASRKWIDHHHNPDVLGGK